MSARVFFISDLHLGHKNILNFAGEYRLNKGKRLASIEEHDNWIVEQWNSVVRKRDIVYVLGDVAFSKGGLQRVKELKGDKKLILGNHDKFPLQDYYEVGFTTIHGFLRYKEFWLSHCPIHPLELRGKVNLCGHTHQFVVPDNRKSYFSVCVESSNGMPISLDFIRATLLVGEIYSEIEAEQLTEKGLTNTPYGSIVQLSK